MVDGDEKGKGIRESIRPTLKEAVYGILGIGIVLKAPGYVRSKLEEQARYQARIFAEETRKQEELYKQKKPEGG